MRSSLLLSTLCSAAIVSGLTVPRHRRDDISSQDFTFHPIPFDEVKADAEKLGVFQPMPDTDNPHNTTTSSSFSSGQGKAAADTDADADLTAAAAGACDNPSIRIEWRDMSDADRDGFISAVTCLLSRPSAGGPDYPASQNRYEDLVTVHQQMTGSIHMVGQFLPWHRYFLSVYESLLRDECGLAGPMPWWDEPKDAGHFATSPLFTDAYFGPIPVKDANGIGACVGSGHFTMLFHVGPGLSAQEHCIGRALDDVATAQCSADFTNYCNSYTVYSDMEKCTEGGPHAYGHNGIGATMADVAAAVSDPVFFMHHSYVDHSWRIWQNADAARLTEINGPTASDGTGVLNLDYVLTSRGLRPDVTVRDVMDTMGGYLCYRYSY